METRREGMGHPKMGRVRCCMLTGRDLGQSGHPAVCSGLRKERWGEDGGEVGVVLSGGVLRGHGRKNCPSSMRAELESDMDGVESGGFQ